MDVIGNVVVAIADQAETGGHVYAGGPLAVEPVGVAEGEGEAEVNKAGLGAGVFLGLINGAHGGAAKNIPFLQVAEVYLQVQQSQGEDIVPGNHILAFQKAEIGAQTTVGHSRRDVADVVVRDADMPGKVPGRLFEFIVMTIGLGQCRKAYNGHGGQSKQFFHHFWF